MQEEQTGSTSQTIEKKSLRLALIVSERAVSEYSTFVERLLVGLADESIAAALVCRPNCGIDSLVLPAVEVVGYPTFDLPLMGPRNRKILAEQLDKFRPTVLHCLCESQAALTRQLSRQLDLPYVLTVNSLQKRWSRFLVSLRRCAKIIASAKSIAADLAQIFPRLGERIELINIGTFVADESKCFSVPSRLACMVTAHPLDNVNDFENLLNAVKHLAIDGYEFMLVVIGSGRAERQLRKLLGALDLVQVVTIVPRLVDWRPTVAAGDVFIQPQPSPAFNPFLLEAMSVGSAVAGCRGGVDDLIIDGTTCVVFDPADELSIYSCLQRLFDRPEFARQLAKGAQQYLRENYTVSKMVADILQVYRDAEQWYGR